MLLFIFFFITTLSNFYFYFLITFLRQCLLRFGVCKSNFLLFNLLCTQFIAFFYFLWIFWLDFSIFFFLICVFSFDATFIYWCNTLISFTILRFYYYFLRNLLEGKLSVRSNTIRRSLLGNLLSSILFITLNFYLFKERWNLFVYKNSMILFLITSILIFFL